MPKKLGLNIWGLLGLYFIYSVISALILGFLYSGWTMLASYPIIILVFGSTLLILFVASVVRTFQRKTHIEVGMGKLRLVGLVQLIAIFLNGGDCGDGLGTSSFFQYVFQPSTICSSNAPSIYSYLNFSILPLILYAVILFAVVVSILSSAATTRQVRGS